MQKKYSFKIIKPDGTVFSFSVQKPLFLWGLFSMVFLALLFVGASGYTVYSALASWDKEREVEELKRAGAIQQEQLLILSKKAHTLAEEANSLEQTENELKRLTAGLPEGPGSHKGEGGPLPTGENQEAALAGELETAEKIKASLDLTEKHLGDLKENLLALRQEIKETRNLPLLGNFHGVSTMPSIWPAVGDISSPYGLRWNGSDFHPGIDIANDMGTPIVATADGTVTDAGFNPWGYGNMVDIDHGGGIITRYAHGMQVLVTVGQYVRRGQIIMLMGSTGFSTGPHVHYEVIIDGHAVNPIGYLH